VAGPAPRLPDRPPTAAHRAPDLVAERRPHRAMERTGLPRLGPDEERLAPDVGTARGRELTRHGVDVPPDDALGHREFAWRVRSRDGADEVGPDRQRSLGAGEPRRATPVEPDPHPGDDIGGVTDEP